MKTLSAEPVTTPCSNLLLLRAQRLIRQAVFRQQGAATARFCRATQFQMRTASVTPCKSPEMAPWCKAEPKGRHIYPHSLLNSKPWDMSNCKGHRGNAYRDTHLMTTPSNVFRTHIFVQLIKPRNHLPFALFCEEGNKRQTAREMP